MVRTFYYKDINITIKEKCTIKRLSNYKHIKIIRGGGINNRVIIGNNINVSNVIIHIIGNNNKIVIRDNCELNNCVLRADGNGNQIYIDSGTYIGGAYVHALGTTSIKIGKECLLSSEIDIRSGEHCIYNLSDKKQYNFGRDIRIGNHVWIGKRVQCLKGVEIADNSVIGAGSLVTKKFEEPNVIIAGHPARVIRTGINWIK